MDLSTAWDVIDTLLGEDTRRVCVFCDTETHSPACRRCHEYKGLMTIDEWESYTGEVWDA